MRWGLILNVLFGTFAGSWLYDTFTTPLAYAGHERNFQAYVNALQGLNKSVQFQFYQAACQMAGWRGPLHRCSFYGNREVGRRLNEMLALGGPPAIHSRPRP